VWGGWHEEFDPDGRIIVTFVPSKAAKTLGINQVTLISGSEAHPRSHSGLDPRARPFAATSRDTRIHPATPGNEASPLHLRTREVVWVPEVAQQDGSGHSWSLSGSKTSCVPP
jgi:hypothetical protein